MASLPSELRQQLGNAVKSARYEAVKGALKALQTLAVDRHEPFGSMGVEERTLRNRLRARGRQLGDVRDKTQGTQRIGHLTHGVAYEHWHRMLFARFLAESDLLIEPDSGVAITTDECTELARGTGEDPHALAARFAQSALPQIFRTGDPVLDLALPPETRQALETLIDELPRAVFTADDSLGWVYQFWQSRKKDEINRSEVKIGADELPAVTQLFTEPYMVRFLLDNTLGSWWASHCLKSEVDLQEADTEAALRRKAAPPGVQLDFLRFVRDEDAAGQARWHPAAGSFDAWPRAPRRPEDPRPLLRFGPLSGRRPFHGGSHAHGAGGSQCHRGGGRRAARQPAWVGVGPPLRGACCLRARARRLDVSRRGGVPAAAGVEPRLLGARAQHGEGTVGRVVGTGCGGWGDAAGAGPVRSRREPSLGAASRQPGSTLRSLSGGTGTGIAHRPRAPSRLLSTNAISSRYGHFSPPFSNKNEPPMSRSSGP